MHPIDIKKSAENELTIEWNNGHKSIFAMDMLRKKCPCATCRTAREKASQSKSPLNVLSGNEIIAENIEVKEAELVGRYALQFTWSDGHREGIYSFDYLMELCQCEACLQSG